MGCFRTLDPLPRPLSLEGRGETEQNSLSLPGKGSKSNLPHQRIILIR